MVKTAHFNRVQSATQKPMLKYLRLVKRRWDERKLRYLDKWMAISFAIPVKRSYVLLCSGTFISLKKLISIHGYSVLLDVGLNRKEILVKRGKQL